MNGIYLILIVVLCMVGCTSPVSTVANDVSPSLPTVMHAVSPTAVLPVETATPTPSPEPPAAIPTMTIPAETFSHLRGATAMAPLAPGVASGGEALAHDLPDVGRIPADVAGWNTYDAKVVALTIPVPPGWLVIEWPVDPDGHAPTFYSASIVPSAYTNVDKYGYQAPNIGLAVYRVPLSTSLSDWLHVYSTTDAFGTELCNDQVYWCGVVTVDETMVDATPALAFTSDAMGIPIYNTLFVVNDIVVALSFSHQGTIPFEPVYEAMLSGIQIGQ